MERVQKCSPRARQALRRRAEELDAREEALRFSTHDRLSVLRSTLSASRNLLNGKLPMMAGTTFIICHNWCEGTFDGPNSDDQDLH